MPICEVMCDQSLLEPASSSARFSFVRIWMMRCAIFAQSARHVDSS